MINEQYENTYFAACNSKNGFISYFDEIFFSDPKRTVYILKGGPGTGKSFFMKMFCEEGKKRGYKAERFLCSSDPDSLDAVIIPELNISVIDGTSPHASDPIYPGAVETIINLGEFFNTDILVSEREKIFTINAKKSRYYKTAYAYLHVCGKLCDIYSNGVRPAVLTDKLRASARREAASYTKAAGECDVSRRFIHAIGTGGEVCTDAFMQAGERVGIADCMGTGYLYIEALMTELKNRVNKMIIHPDPLSPERNIGLYLPDQNVSYTVIASADERFTRTVNQRRFVDKKMIGADSAKLKFAKKSADSLKSEALFNLRKAGEAHAELEKIYTAAMDLKSKEAFSRSFIAQIFEKN